MRINEYNLGFVGFGHMAEIILKAFFSTKMILNSKVHFVRKDPKKAQETQKKFSITSTTLENLISRSDIIFLAVRPGQLPEVLREISKINPNNKIFLTIAAGVSLKSYRKYFHPSNKIVRIMPNVASELSEGVSVISFEPEEDSSLKSQIIQLFNCLGLVEEVDESLMDVCCALFGSGPGFVFRFIKTFAKFGQMHGLNYATALKLSSQVFIGSASMIQNGSDPDLLIDQIATPNGTTQAGLKKMNELNLERLIFEVLQASKERSHELSQEKLV